MAIDDEQVYGFRKSDAMELLDSIGGVDMENDEWHDVGGGGGGSRVIHFKSKVGGIPAISGSTMGSASCDKYVSSAGGVLSDSGVDVTIYNTAAAFAATTFGIAAMNEAGLWVAIVEKC